MRVPADDTQGNSERASAPTRARRVTDDKPIGALRQELPGGEPTPEWQAAAHRRALRFEAEEPIALPVSLGWPLRRTSTYFVLVPLAIGLVASVAALASNGWRGTLPRATALAIWTYVVIKAALQPDIRITSTGIEVRQHLLGARIRARRDQVAHLVDHRPGRVSLRTTGARKWVTVPTDRLTADERRLLARILAHYDLRKVFT